MTRKKSPGDHDPPFGGKAPRLHRYILDGGWEVLAGKTDHDNEQLSLKLANPNDWWFHVRGVPGSHVILRTGTGGDPPKEVLKQAAAVAVYHSKARNAGLTPVACTRARHVGKARGAKTGTVTIRNERVIKVRPALPESRQDRD